MSRRLIWLGAAGALVIAYFVMMAFFTTAKVTIFASANKVDVDSTFIVDTTATTTNLSTSTLAGQTVSSSKDLTATFTATGQQDAGTKATGTVTIKNCEDSNSYPLAAGNTLTSGGLNFVTVAATTIPGGTFSGGGTTCTSPTASVAIVAAQNGDNYNLTNASFTSPKLTANFRITAAQLSGGTSKVITIVSQDDINKAQKGALDDDAGNTQKTLDAAVPAGYLLLTSSLAQTSTGVVSNPAVNQQGTSATLSFKVTYSELAVKKVDYNALIDRAVKKQVGGDSQVYDNGIATATVTPTGKTTSGAAGFHFASTAFAGAKLDTAEIATAIKGKRYGDAQNYLGHLPGVVQSQISLWPAWASNLPGRASKITITISVANTK